MTKWQNVWHQSKIKPSISRLSLFTFDTIPGQENLPLPCYFLPATSPWRVFFDENNAPFSTGPWTPDSHGCNSYIEIYPWKLISLGAAVRKMAPSEKTNFVAPTFDGPCILLKDTQWLLKDPYFCCNKKPTIRWSLGKVPAALAANNGP